VGRLLDVDCDETTINGLLASVMGNFPIDELVHEVGQRNRLMLILPSLAARLGHDPYLAYIAYAKGFCDDELSAISMFKQQAHYLSNVASQSCGPKFLFPTTSIAASSSIK